MSNLTIFKHQLGASPNKGRELSPLAQSLASNSMSRRIQTNTNGTFKRIVNGEQIGDAIRGEINVIILAALPKVSRIFYKESYDPSKEATLPNCWSNLGDIPETAASDAQSENCLSCPQNVQGSGPNGSRACRFQRRIAMLVEGDATGEVYQFNIPAKSLFGKGTGNDHPFESYIKYLLANNESPDNVVTTIQFNDNAETMELLFSPSRGLTDAEYELKQVAQANPDTERYTHITVAQTDGVNKLPVAEAPKAASPEAPAEVVEEDEVAEVAPPKKRASKKKAAPEATNPDLAALVDAWSEE